MKKNFLNRKRRRITNIEQENGIAPRQAQDMEMERAAVAYNVRVRRRIAHDRIHACRCGEHGGDFGG